jgi:tetratricopeptide (TPR) repeat protein
MMRKLYIVSFILLSLIPAIGQNLPDIIRQRSKAVASVSCYSVAGSVIDRVNGFFLSSDGIMIMPAYPFSKSDSVVVTIHNGRKLQVERVLSVHWHYNMAMVKVGGGREFDFMSPEKRSIRETDEVLVLVHESAGAQSEVVRIGKVMSIPEVARIGLVSTNIGQQSSGAPVINARGNLVGVFLDHESKSDCLLSSLFIDDSGWIPVNSSPAKLYGNSHYRLRLRSDFIDGLKSACISDFGEASKFMSLYIKNSGDDARAYFLRAMMRLNYGNEAGSNNDISYLLDIFPDNYAGFYLSGLSSERKGRYEEAMDWYGKASYVKQTSGVALLALSRMVLRNRKDVKGAFDLVSQAVFKDSLLAQAYLERGKMLLQHSSKTDKALADLSQAIYLDPDIEGVFTIRGTIFFDSQNYSLAIRDFDEAIKRKPNDMHALLNRGVAYYNMGLKDKACKDWDKASRLGNDKAYKFISRYCSDNVRSF